MGPFRLADHPAPARPAVERRIAEVPVAAGRLAGRGRLRFGLEEFDGDLLDEPLIAGEAEHEVDPVLFAPGHQRFAGETGIGAQKNARPGPPRPYLPDDPRDFLDRSGRAVDVRRPQLGRHEMPAAEHIQRQIAVAIVITVKEPAFLMAMQRVVGGVEVEHDLPGRPCVRLEEQVDEQGLDRRRVVADLVVAGRDLARQFEAVERRLARRRRAVAAPSLELARQHRHQRVVTKLVVIVQVFVAERDAEHALPDERGHRVLDEPLVSRVAETSRKPPNQIHTPIRGAQQQAAGVRCQRAAIELGHHWTALDPSKRARFCATLRLHRAASPNWRKSFSQNNFCLIRRPDALPV